MNSWWAYLAKVEALELDVAKKTTMVDDWKEKWEPFKRKSGVFCFCFFDTFICLFLSLFVFYYGVVYGTDVLVVGIVL